MSINRVISLLIVGFAAIGSATSLGQTTNPQSNTIATNLLIINFSLQPSSDGTTLVAEVDMEQAAASNGVETEVDLTQSTNDVVTFTGGGATLTYDPTGTNPNTMPIAAGGTYTMTFTRFNGETYTNSITMPATATFSSPTPNQVFQKTDVVNIAWTMTMADFTEASLSTSCTNTAGDFTVNDAWTAATIPAGYVSACTGNVSMEFDMINASIGNGFGTFVGLTDGAIQFSYADPSSVVRLTSAHKAHDYKQLVRKIALAHRAGVKRLKQKI